jgi:hypothetical protein
MIYDRNLNKFEAQLERTRSPNETGNFGTWQKGGEKHCE